MTDTGESRRGRLGRPKQRFGIGEWYGVPLTSLNAEERRGFADIQQLPKSRRPPVPCPFQLEMTCNKAGGVCSLRLYEESAQTGAVEPVVGEQGYPRTVCPKRFEEGGVVFRWVAETMLGTSEPLIIGEVDFLDSSHSSGRATARSAVGRIDKVLVLPGSQPLSWCALEFQAVYFQGPAMGPDLAAFRDRILDTLPFPSAVRRPDYRSSGPKRLMPQLQIKVPSLRRWGKKMAVVVDLDFFLAMGEMRTVPNISNCDVAWFVVRYEATGAGRYRLVPDKAHLTTLEDSVEGLTAGIPVSLETFEKRMLAKLERRSGPL